MIFTVKCAQCGKDFSREESHIKRVPKYCSHECVVNSQRREVNLYTCQSCGKIFRKSGKIGAKYCSMQCLKDDSGVLINCEYCGKLFKTHPSTANNGRKFCSIKCKTANAHKPKANNRTCLNCGKGFYANKSSIKYCSRQCGYSYRSREPAISNISNAHRNNFRNTRVNCTCKKCGKQFYVKESAKKHGMGVFCSMNCRKIAPVELKCKLCGKIFYKLPSQIKQKGYGGFCSLSCRSQFNMVNLFHESPTSIEKAIIDELDRRKIQYEFQYPLFGFVLDFAFPENRLAVEADGKYWHSLEHAVNRDKQRNAALIKNGWHVLRLDEDVINASASMCVDIITNYLQSPKISQHPRVLHTRVVSSKSR